MTNLERLALNRIKITFIRYWFGTSGSTTTVLSKNEAMKAMLRKAEGEKIRYSVGSV